MPGFSPEKFVDTTIAPTVGEQSPVIPDIRRDVPVQAPDTHHGRGSTEMEQSIAGDTRLPGQQAQEIPLPGKKKTVAHVAVGSKTPERVEIEKVLAESVMEVYQMLTPKEQEQFRKAGEEAVTKIEMLVTQFRATARTVLQIIRQWLLTIPRINKFFLEQESKIKTDRILKLQQKFKVQNHKTHI